jgi:hypothetical protein
MKSLAIVSLVVSAGAVFACSGDPEDPYIPPSTGGTGAAGGTGGAGGSSAGVGGAMAGIGGAVGGVGGALAGTGGTFAGSGGTAGTAGTATGGAAGSFAGTGGVAGAGNTAGDGPTGGMSGTSGASGAGPMGGLGGMTDGGMGGMSAGGMAGMSAGGMGGMSGTGGTGSAVPTVQELVGALDGHLVTTPCGNQPGGDDCTAGGWRSTAVDNGANHSCNQGRLEAVITLPIGGVDCVEYDVLMHFYGIMEPRQYSNVMREAGGATNRTGSTPTGWASATGNAAVYNMGDNNYNTYEIHVYNNATPPVRVAQYFLNSDSGTGHYTLITNYEKTITLIGGGEVRLRVFDANCTMIKNCGANGGTGAACSTNARTVDIAAAMPQPTGMPGLAQPALGAQSAQHSGQWWLIDVKSVALAN